MNNNLLHLDKNHLVYLKIIWRSHFLIVILYLLTLTKRHGLWVMWRATLTNILSTYCNSQKICDFHIWNNENNLSFILILRFKTFGFFPSKSSILRFQLPFEVGHSYSAIHTQQLRAFKQFLPWGTFLTIIFASKKCS